MTKEVIKVEPMHVIPTIAKQVLGVVCDFCGEVEKVDAVYFLEGRSDKKVVVCDRCEQKLGIVH